MASSLLHFLATLASASTSTSGVSMKKLIVAVLATLALVFTGVATAPVASAAPSIQTQTSVSTKGSTAVAPPSSISGVKPTWYTLNGYCYWGMDGGYYCYRYGCTNFEYWFYGCRDGWYRVNNWYA